MREIEIEYTNWDINDIVCDLAQRINNGFKITSYSSSFSYRESEITVRLIEPYKK
jgi:hypothetical protein